MSMMLPYLNVAGSLHLIIRKRCQKDSRLVSSFTIYSCFLHLLAYIRSTCSVHHFKKNVHTHTMIYCNYLVVSHPAPLINPMHTGTREPLYMCNKVQTKIDQAERAGVLSESYTNGIQSYFFGLLVTLLC